MRCFTLCSCKAVLRPGGGTWYLGHYTLCNYRLFLLGGRSGIFCVPTSEHRIEIERTSVRGGEAKFSAGLTESGVGGAMSHPSTERLERCHEAPLDNI
jgi:hypothetical protein